MHIHWPSADSAGVAQEAVKLEDLVPPDAELVPSSCPLCDTRNIALYAICIYPSSVCCVHIDLTDEHYNRSSKLRNMSIPDQIQFLAFSTITKRILRPYQLLFVILHTGKSMDAGHYTTLVKNKGDWYHLDDQRPVPYPTPLGTDFNRALALVQADIFAQHIDKEQLDLNFCGTSTLCGYVEEKTLRGLADPSTTSALTEATVAAAKKTVDRP